MNPVKKTINPNNTNSSPWLLCPSKSIPGRFYYFNGATGDAVWTISDVDVAANKCSADLGCAVVENRVLTLRTSPPPPLSALDLRAATYTKSKKDTIQRIMDKAHSYPEPISSPNDESTNTTNSFSSVKNVTPEFPINTPKDINHGPLPEPTLGQAVIPKYDADIHTPNVIWAFTPLYLPEHREMMDRPTQTYESNPIFVQNPVSCQNPFQNIKRTLNFAPEFQFNQTLTQNVKDQPVFTFGQTPTSQIFKEQPIFGQTPAFNPFKTSSTPMFVPMQREACKTFVPIQRRGSTQSKSDSTPKSVLKASRSVENLTSLFTKDAESSTVSPDDKKADKLSELSKNDLRLLLVAKKKKVVSDEAAKSTDQSIKTQESVTSKKRVTFVLQQPRDPNSEDSPEIDQSLNSPQIDNPSISEGLLWYVATDTSVLLSQIHSIEQFVKKDPFCRLLIPYAVYKEIEALSHRDCGVMSAQQLLRRLGIAPPHIVVQIKPEYKHASSEDSILQCCWDLLQDNCRVILITDNISIMNKAKSIHLECHTPEEMTTMKENRKPAHTPTEHLKDIRNMKIIVSNDKKKSENLFLQDFSEINNFPFSKNNGYSVKIDQSKTLLSAESKDDTVFSKKDTNSDKLINLTRPKNSNAKTCELTNVNDQILKLSIADNSATNNRTKQILQNVFRNPEVNKINQDNKFVFDDKNKNNQNLSEINKVNSVNQNSYDISNETNLHIRKLKVTENNPIRAKDNINVSGITKLNTHFNLDDDLERFYVKNKIMENRIKSRLDEWICRLNQTMEEVLTEVLLKEKVKGKNIMPPCNFFEALQLTGEAFKKHHKIKTIVDRFSMKHLSVCTSNNGMKNMKPIDLMKLFGVSIILLQNLKEIVNYKELHEAYDMMSDLIKNIEDPNTDMDFTLEKVNAPIFIRSEIPEPKIPISFKKSDADVIGYLKRHFEAWKSYEIDSPKETNVVNVETTTVKNKEPNVVRTFGKNLNMLKINSSKTITMEETDKVNIEPKVIRNVTCIEAFEEKLKQKQELDMNKLDYDGSLYTITKASDDEDDNIGAAKIYEVTDEKSNELAENNIRDLDSASSELDAECVQAYPLVKLFLIKLKRTFIQIYCFIHDSMKEYQKGMTLEKKKDVKLKTEIAHGYVLKITQRLKNIISRESGNATTLKDLLIKAGDYVENDKVISNYSNVVAQYLEQAEILEEALTILLSLSHRGIHWDLQDVQPN